jgi:rRNA maturation endonuclease Nob1
MIFWLKAHFPDRYRWAERVEATGADGGAIKIASLSETDRQIEVLAAELQSRARQSVVAGDHDAD